MKTYNYKILIEPIEAADGGGYYASVPKLPGCMTDAETVEEAIEKIQDSIDLWVAINSEMGKSIPEPDYYSPQETYSGRFALRMSKRLHKEVAECAKAEGVSLNAWLNTVIARDVGVNTVELSAESSEKKRVFRSMFHIKNETTSPSWKKAIAEKTFA